MIEFGNVDHGIRIMTAMSAKFSPNGMTVISRSEQDDLRGGVVYENYTGKGGTCVVHFAGFHDNWINRDLLWVGFHYPFVQMECNSIFAQVKSRNWNSRNVVAAMGYKEVILLPNVYPDDDMILYRLYKEDCKYLDIKPKNVSYGRMLDHG